MADTIFTWIDAPDILKYHFDCIPYSEIPAFVHEGTIFGLYFFF